MSPTASLAPPPRSAPLQAALAPLVVAAVARPCVDVDVLAVAVPELAARLEALRAAAEAFGV